MARIAIALFFFVLVTHSWLPAVYAVIARPIHEHCLKSSPIAESIEIRRIQESLVCGRNLKDPRGEFQAWRELGLIHILVVSGGHLSILAIFLRVSLLGILNVLSVMMPSAAVFRTSRLNLMLGLITFLAITWLTAANQFQPPILRAWFDHLLRPRLKRLGYEGTEIGLVATWLALPSVTSQSALISLGLSFFASTLVEFFGRNYTHRPWLGALCFQSALWWALLPLLLPLGIPHPLATLSNLALAPLFGGVLIPMAMLHHGLAQLDFLWLKSLFAWTWELNHSLVQMTAEFTPGLARPLALAETNQLVAGLALLVLGLALTSRQSALGRKSRRRSAMWPSFIFAFLLTTLGATVHGYIPNSKSELAKTGAAVSSTPAGDLTNERPPSSKASLSGQSGKLRKKTIKRGRVCIPYPASERPARNRYCRRKH